MQPTTADKIIPYYVWFVYGFGVISIIIGILNFGMLLVTMITVKGLQIPLWMIPIVATILIALCTATGYFFEKYKIWARIISQQNKKANPEVSEILSKVDLILAEVRK